MTPTTIIDVLPYFLEGAKIKRLVWNFCWCKEDGNFFIQYDDGSIDNIELDFDDILAEDWVVIV